MQEKPFNVRENVEATPENVSRFFDQAEDMLRDARAVNAPVVLFVFDEKSGGFVQQGVNVCDEHIAKLTVAMMKSNPLAMSWAFQESVRKAEELASAMSTPNPEGK